MGKVRRQEARHPLAQRARWVARGVSWRGILVLTFALLVLPRAAAGSLAGDVASVTVDRAQMNARDEVVAGPGGDVHTMTLPSGTVVREYLSASGLVFAITWRGPFRPNLRQLLGRYFEAFESAAQANKGRRAGRGPVAVERPELVVHLGGHPRAFFGRAYVPGLVPQGVSAAEMP